MKTDKHIDLTYLKQLSNGSNEFVTEMMTVFSEQTPTELDKLEQELKAKDWKSLRATAHKIKPSLAFMGIKELEETIKQIEEYADKEINLVKLPEMIAKVKSVCESAMQELKEEMEMSN
jgi:HPt (histidine-containing phosphotransfer) domain-containing protein